MSIEKWVRGLADKLPCVFRFLSRLIAVGCEQIHLQHKIEVFLGTALIIGNAEQPQIEDAMEV